MQPEGPHNDEKEEENKEQINNNQMQLSKRRRTKKDLECRDYICGCGKTYLSQPALYTHLKQKHGGNQPEGTKMPKIAVPKKGRPKVKNEEKPQLETSEKQSDEEEELLDPEDEILFFQNKDLEKKETGDLSMEAKLKFLDEICPKDRMDKEDYSRIYDHLIEFIDKKEWEEEEKMLDAAAHIKEELKEWKFNLKLNKVFAIFLWKVSKQLNKKALQELFIFVCLFGKALKVHQNDIDFCEKNTSEKALDICKLFQQKQLIELLNKSPKLVELKLPNINCNDESEERRIILTEQFCRWLNKSQFAKNTIETSQLIENSIKEMEEEKAKEESMKKLANIQVNKQNTNKEEEYFSKINKTKNLIKKIRKFSQMKSEELPNEGNESNGEEKKSKEQEQVPADKLNKKRKNRKSNEELGEKKFQCECGKAQTQNSSLYTHRKIKNHWGESEKGNQMQNKIKAQKIEKETKQAEPEKKAEIEIDEQDVSIDFHPEDEINYFQANQLDLKEKIKNSEDLLRFLKAILDEEDTSIQDYYEKLITNEAGKEEEKKIDALPSQDKFDMKLDRVLAIFLQKFSWLLKDIAMKELFIFISLIVKALKKHQKDKQFCQNHNGNFVEVAFYVEFYQRQLKELLKEIENKPIQTEKIKSQFQTMKLKESSEERQITLTEQLCRWIFRSGFSTINIETSRLIEDALKEIEIPQEVNPDH